jgi:hypothetical protein
VPFHFNKSAKIASAILATCAYFLSAYWLDISYQPDPNFVVGPDVPGEKVRLLPPFAGHQGSPFAAAKERYQLFDDLFDN